MPTDPENLPAGKDPDFSELLKLMHVVDVERQKRDLALEELTVSEQKDRLREELVKVYKAEGAVVSDAEINAAIEAHYADRYTFVPPPRTFGYRLARIYVRRGFYATRILLPLLILAGVFLGGDYMLQAKARRLREEAAAQVQKALDRFRVVTSEAMTDSTAVSNQFAVLKAGAPEKLSREGTEHIQNAAATIAQIEQQLAALRAPVTLENAAKVQDTLERGQTNLGTARNETRAAREVISALQKLQEAKSALDLALKEVEQSQPTASLLRKAKQEYEAGQQQVSAGNELLAMQHATALRDLTKTWRSGQDMAQTAERLLSFVQLVAKESTALEQAKELFQKIAATSQSDDLSSGQKSLAQLRELKDELDLSYILRIVDRPGTKSGVARTPRNQRNVNYYYLVVEAITPENRALTRTIINEETQNAQKTSIWAERVPKELYDQVKTEKTQRGRVEDKKLMSKERGYLSFAPGRLKERVGQITRWD